MKDKYREDKPYEVKMKEWFGYMKNWIEEKKLLLEENKKKVKYLQGMIKMYQKQIKVVENQIELERHSLALGLSDLKDGERELKEYKEKNKKVKTFKKVTVKAKGIGPKFESAEMIYNLLQIKKLKPKRGSLIYNNKGEKIVTIKNSKKDVLFVFKKVGAGEWIKIMDRNWGKK